MSHRSEQQGDVHSSLLQSAVKQVLALPSTKQVLVKKEWRESALSRILGGQKVQLLGMTRHHDTFPSLLRAVRAKLEARGITFLDEGFAKPEKKTETDKTDFPSQDILQRCREELVPEVKIAVAGKISTPKQMLIFWMRRHDVPAGQYAALKTVLDEQLK